MTWPTSTSDLGGRISPVIASGLQRGRWPDVKDPVARDQGSVSTFPILQTWKNAARRLRQMGGVLPGVLTLMVAFDKILVMFNQCNLQGNWFYQVERNNPHGRCVAGTGCKVFHYCRGQLESDIHDDGLYAHHNKGTCHRGKTKGEVERRRKWLAWKQRMSECSLDSKLSPLKTEGPVPLKQDSSSMAPKQDGPGKGKASPGKGSDKNQARPVLSKKGQRCVRIFRGICSRGQQCDYGHILGPDGKPLPIAPELLARYDKRAADRREAKKRALQFSTQMLMLDYFGANSLVLPKMYSMCGSDAQCSVSGETLCLDWWFRHWLMRSKSIALPQLKVHARNALGMVLLAGWRYQPQARKGRFHVEICSPQGDSIELTEKFKTYYLDRDVFVRVMQDVRHNCSILRGMSLQHPNRCCKRLSTARYIVGRMHAVKAPKTGSIRFLETQARQRTYMCYITEITKSIQEITWPYQNLWTSVAGGSSSRAPFTRAETNRGLENGRVVKRTLDPQYPLLLQKVLNAVPMSCRILERPHDARKGPGAMPTYANIVNTAITSDQLWQAWSQAIWISSVKAIGWTWKDLGSQSLFIPKRKRRQEFRLESNLTRQ